jgi:hypothetical protein
VAEEVCLTVGSSSYATGLFFVPIKAARAVVPDDYFHIAEVVPGRAVFFVGTGEFRDSDLGPYNELYVGFYTENRERSRPPGRITNLAEFARNRSKMFMWKNWLSSQKAMDRMDEAGATLFRRGEVSRTDTEATTVFAMEHADEGAIQFEVPRDGRSTKDDFDIAKTHYGRLHDRPSRVELNLHVDHMVTSPRGGELTMQGAIADQCAPLGIPKRPLVSIWIEEMHFTMSKPSPLPR